MPYPPENNPYVPGDPYSYDLKWMVEEIKKQRDPEEQAAIARQAAIEANQSANEAKQIAEDLDSEMRGYMDRAETAAGAAETSAISAANSLDTLSSQIPPAVEDWLNIHVTQPTTPVIDTSLLISGAGADAAVVGDLFSKFDRTRTSPVLSWNPQYIDASGNVSSSLYTVLCDIVPVHEGDMIINNTPAQDSNGIYYTMYLITYSGGVFQQKIGISSAGTRKQIIPSGIDGIAFNFGRLQSSGVQFSDSDLADWIIDYYIRPASYQELKELQEVPSTTPVPSMFSYTDFDEQAGYWRADGTLTANLTHTQGLRIIPNGKCYISNVPNQTVIGAWFDRNGSWIGPLNDTDLTQFNYKSPSEGSGSFTFAPIYEFTAPANAYFLSLNLKTTMTYKNYVCSAPALQLTESGNICLYDDPAYQKTKSKKLCIIGASTAMIDRFYSSALGEYLIGWQDYLAPFYDLIDTYGYSGGSMGSRYTAYTSIYDGIVGGSVDLSSYDDFIILGTKNGLTTTLVGSWGSIDNTVGEHDTYFGGLRSIVDYIYTQNPYARIFITNLTYDQRYFNSSYQNLCVQVNNETERMCNGMGLTLIDLRQKSGFNYQTYLNYTYDGTHFNQLGSYRIGTLIRQEVIGF